MTDHNEYCLCSACMSSGPSVEAPPREQFACECGTVHSSFRFDNERDEDGRKRHDYYLDEKQIDSVSRVLELIGLRKDFNLAAELGAEKGTNVHKTIELADRDEIQNYRVDPAARPYLAQWSEAKRFLGIDRFEEIEHPWFGWIGGKHVSGTCDRIARVDGVRTVIDVKTGKPRPNKAYRMQTALYSLIFKCEGRILIYLTGTGELDVKRDIERHENARDLAMAEQQCAYCVWRRTG